MADVGVIALDPVRLRGLEVYLHGLGDGCRQRAGRVADEVAGSGLAADAPIGELERLAVVCHRERDEVAWRRALVEAIPDDLPRPTRRFRDADAADRAGRHLADEVIDALAEHPRRWARLAALLAELARSGGSRPFSVGFLSRLGARRASDLPLALERAWRAARTDPEGPGLVDDAVLADAERALAAAIRTASQVEGEAGLDPTWSRVYAGVPADDGGFALAEQAATPAQRSAADRVEDGLRAAGYGTQMAKAVAAKVGWSEVASAIGRGTGLVRLATAVAALDDGDGRACDGAQAGFGVAAGVVLLLAPPSAPAAVVSGALGVVSWVFSACRRQEPRTNETTPTADPSTGATRLPSGHASNPHVDTAGVPLPPSYG